MKKDLKQYQSNCCFNSLNCDYFFQKMLGNLNKKISLGILKYNKNLQKRANLKNSDYKAFHEIIEIELIPI